MVVRCIVLRYSSHIDFAELPLPMKVYLVQHGANSPEGEDPQQGLTSQAAVDVEKMARFIGQMNQQYEAVFHSDKKGAPIFGCAPEVLRWAPSLTPGC